MTDPFSTLGLPETLILEPGAVDAAWQKLAREEAGGEGANESVAAARNESRALLSDPVLRLERWLDLRDPTGGAGRAIDPALMDLFAKTGPVLAGTDALLARHGKASTALARALLAKEAVEAQLAVQALLQEIQALKSGFLDRYSEYETAGAAGDFSEARRALGQLKFLRRWEEQCRARLLALLET